MTWLYLPPKDNLVPFSSLLPSLQNENPVSFARGFWPKLLEGNESEFQLRTQYKQQTRKREKTEQFGLCDMEKAHHRKLREKKTHKIK